MRLLLDTHTILWFTLDLPRIGPAALSAIADPSNEKFASPASYWELAIKIGTGKYALTQPFEEFVRVTIDNNGFNHLPISPRHAAALAALPFHHRDPFDRMLVAQALTEGMTLLGADAAIDSYSVWRIW